MILQTPGENYLLESDFWLLPSSVQLADDVVYIV